jgi:hypothetical protein
MSHGSGMIVRPGGAGRKNAACLLLSSLPQQVGRYPDERSVNNSIRVAAEAVSAMGWAGDPVPRHLSLAAKYGH